LNRGSFATEVDGEPGRGSFAAEAAGEPGLGLIVCAEAPTVIPVTRSFAEANR
jgi:hypothetical protein